MRTSREAVCGEVVEAERLEEAAALPATQGVDDEGGLELPELGSLSDLALAASLVMLLVLVVWTVGRLL